MFTRKWKEISAAAAAARAALRDQNVQKQNNIQFQIPLFGQGRRQGLKPANISWGPRPERENKVKTKVHYSSVGALVVPGSRISVSGSRGKPEYMLLLPWRRITAHLSPLTSVCSK